MYGNAAPPRRALVIFCPDYAKVGLDWKAVLQVAVGLSYADIVRACDDAAKEAVLGDQGEVSMRALMNALQRRRSGRRS